MDSSSQRFGVNASYVESLRAQWEQDPSSVAEEWRAFFADQAPVEAKGNGNGANGNGANGNGHKAHVEERTVETVVPVAVKPDRKSVV